MKKMLVGNWKANYTSSMLTKLAHVEKKENVDIYIAAPYLYINAVKQNLPSHYNISAQDCSQFSTGAFTGEIPAKMLFDFGVKQVIIGHSERRQHNKESDDTLKNKMEKALCANLQVIYCVGETIEQKDNAKDIIKSQLQILKKSKTVDIAYEPVYAIGTGIVPKNNEIEEILRFIKQEMEQLNVTGKILYGGSVTKENAKDLCKIKHLDGFLVGGASIKDDFLQLIQICNDN